MKSLPSLLLLGLTSASFSQAPATKPPAADDTQKLQEVVITADKDKGYKADAPASVTRMPEAILDSARSVQVVTPKVLQDRAIVNPQDAIQTVSGVQRSAYNTGGGETYLVRGFRQQNFLKDGFRAGTVTGGNILSGAPPTDVANLQSVEVLKGPAAVEFGRGEPGGFVNYATRDAAFQNSFGIHQQIGSFDFYRSQVNANWEAVPEVLAMRLDGGYELGGNFIEHMDSERLFLSTALFWQISERTALTIKAEHNHDDRINTPGLPYLNGGVLTGVPTDRFFGETDFTNLLTNTFRTLVKLEHRWNEAHKTTLSVHGMESDQEGGYFILATFGGPFLNPVNGNIARAAAGVDFMEQNFTVRLDHLYTATLANDIQNDLLLSLEYDYQHNDNQRGLSSHTGLNPYDPIYTGFSPAPLVAIPGFPLFLRESTDIDAISYSGMFMNRLNINDKVFLTLGARLEWFQASNITRYSAPPFRNVNTEYEQVNINPSAGIVVKPLPSLSLYASMAQSTFSLQNVNRITSAGGTLDAERSRQLEVGVKKEFLDGRILGSLAFFQIDKSDVAAADPANPLFSINSGSERTRGFEFDLNGEIASGWNLSFNYTYLDSRVRSSLAPGFSGSRRFGVPENSGGIFTTYEVQEGALKGLGFGGGVFMSDRVKNATGVQGTLPGWVQTDALLYYKIGKARLQFNVKNIFDNDIYFSQGQGTMVQAAPGRTFLAGVRFDF
jgi:iron complex outermembrane receptor protein